MLSERGSRKRERAKSRKKGERRLAGSQRVACGHAGPDDSSPSVSRFRDHLPRRGSRRRDGHGRRAWVTFQGSTAEPSKFTVTPPVLGASIESKRKAAPGWPWLSLRIIAWRRSIALFPESGALPWTPDTPSVTCRCRFALGCDKPFGVNGFVALPKNHYLVAQARGHYRCGLWQFRSPLSPS